MLYLYGGGRWMDTANWPDTSLLWDRNHTAVLVRFVPELIRPTGRQSVLIQEYCNTPAVKQLLDHSKCSSEHGQRGTQHISPVWWGWWETEGGFRAYQACACSGHEGALGKTCKEKRSGVGSRGKKVCQNDWGGGGGEPILLWETQKERILSGKTEADGRSLGNLQAQA